jgi:hypothetical protein
MAETRKSIIDEAFMEAEAIERAFMVNSKEILAHTMGSEIEQMVKESLKDSGDLNEDEDEEEVDLELDMDMDSDEAGLDAGDEIDLELGDDEIDLDDMDDMDMLDMDSDDDFEEVDLTGMDDEAVISVFKKMAPEDEIEVVQTGDGVEIKDNATGAEYRIELGGMDMDSDDDMDMDMMDMDSDDDMDMDMMDMDSDEEEVEYHIELDDEDENMEELEDENMEEASRTYGSGKRFGRGLDKPKAAPRHLHQESRSLFREVEERTVNASNVDKYVQGTKISSGILSRQIDRGVDVKMFSNKDKQTGSDGRHKKVFQVGDEFYNERNVRIPGGKAEAMEYLNESRTPMSSALVRENKVLKNQLATVTSENETLREDYNKMVDALKEFRQKLNEVAVFNSNLTYTVRLFTEHSTTKDEKVDIIKRFDDAKSLKESKNIYKNLVKEISKTKSPIKESIDNKLNETKSSGSATQITESKVYVHPEMEKMKKLWEYDYKK